MQRRPANPRELAEVAEKIYNTKYRIEFEAHHMGKFAAIDVVTEQAFIGDTPEAAYNQARQAAPGGLFHLIRVGEPGAFRVSYASNAVDWIFR